MKQLTPEDYCFQVEEAKKLWEDYSLTASDYMFVWEDAAQAQCNEYNMTMYQRMEIIAKVFNTYL